MTKETMIKLTKEIMIKRTEEVEDYMVLEALAMITLGNMLVRSFPDLLYEAFENKPLTKKDFARVVAEVVMQYDAQFGVSRWGNDPVLAKKIKEELDRREEEGLVEIVPDKEGL